MLCLLACGCAHSQSERAADRLPDRPSDRIIDRAFLRDPGGQLQVQDMATQAFKPYSGTLTLGNSNTVTWLRLTVQPAETGPWVLLLQPTLIQDARVYAPRAGGGGGSWSVQQLGNRFPHSQRLSPELNHVAPLPLAGSQPVTVYVRVHTPSALVLARVVSADDARELDARTLGAVGLYSGICLSFLLLSLVGWLATREPLWLCAGMLDLTSVVLMLAQMGFAAKYLLPDSVNVVNRLVLVVGCASLAAVCLFSWRLLLLFGARRWCYAPYVAGLGLAPLPMLLMAAGRFGPALAVNNLIVLLLSVWALLVIWFVRPEDRALRWMWRGMALVLAGYSLFWVTPFVLHVQSTQLSLYPAFPSNLFTALTTAAIAGRYTLVRSRSLRAAEQARRDADQRLVQERVRHEQTSGFLGMLVHEVRNPLALIQAMARRIADAPAGGNAAQQQPQALATIDRCAGDIGAMLDRSLETDQLERGALQMCPQAEDAAQRLRGWLALHRERERIQAELPDTLVATFDAGLWLSMVRNLVENALKYGPPDAPVQLRLHDAGNQLCVDVRNRVGRVGRPDPALLFNKYYRAAGTEGLSGTGLGLYWVQQLSQRMGGSLQYLPAPAPEAAGDRVAFRLCLPF